MSNVELDEVVHEIYRAASSPELWPELLDNLYAFLDESKLSGEQLLALDKQRIQQGEQHLLAQAISNLSVDELAPSSNLSGEALLLRHFSQAIDIVKKIQAHERLKGLVDLLLDKMPAAVLLLDTQRQPVFMNSIANNILASKLPISLCDGKVCMLDKQQQTWLDNAVDELSNNPIDDDTYNCFICNDDNEAAVILSKSTIASAPVVMFISSLSEILPLDQSLLKKMYGFSKKELEIAKNLTSGDSIKDIAKKYHSSEHTVRTHVKSMLAKTNTKRQASLIQLLVSVPAKNNSLREKALDDVELYKLNDGRYLAYCDTGNTKGFPLIYSHSVVGSRLEIPQVFCDALYKAGFRVITIDRPDYGCSSLDKGRTFMSYAQDAEQLLHYLKISSCALLGYAMGVNYSLALAAQLTEQVKFSVLVGGGVAPQTKAEYVDVFPVYAMNLKLAKHFPKLQRNFSGIMKKGLQSNPKSIVDRFFSFMTVEEKKLISTNWFEMHFIKNVVEALRPDCNYLGASSDAALYMQPWNIALDKISSPTFLFHGTLDRHTPIVLAEKLCEKIPNASLQAFDGYGTFLFYSQWKFLLAFLKQKLSD